MALTPVQLGTFIFIEGSPGEPLMVQEHDVDRVIEECFSYQAHAALLYAQNLTPGFFDLSTREAGNILQKLRNYHIRLAIVNPPGGSRLSSRFGELLTDEMNKAYFGIFDTRAGAAEWLERHAGDSW